MFHNRTLNNRINRIHEKALRIVYSDSSSSFADLLHKDSSVTIRQRNLQSLATELYKIKNDMAPEIMQDIFPVYNPKYNLRNNREFTGRNAKSVYHGTETLSFIGYKIWQQILEESKKCHPGNPLNTKLKSGYQIAPADYVKNTSHKSRMYSR